jgi:hypothetical protein
VPVSTRKPITMKKLLTIIFLILFANITHGNTLNEINHLLDFVSKTDCTYDRNGSKHNGKEARKHIEKKYNYYKDKIKTAEDFITYSVTKSVLSGKIYKVYCSNKQIQNSKDWLLIELSKYRSSN